MIEASFERATPRRVAFILSRLQSKPIWPRRAALFRFSTSSFSSFFPSFSFLPSPTTQLTPPSPRASTKQQHYRQQHHQQKDAPTTRASLPDPITGRPRVSSAVIPLVAAALARAQTFFSFVFLRRRNTPAVFLPDRRRWSPTVLQPDPSARHRRGPIERRVGAPSTLFLTGHRRRRARRGAPVAQTREPF